MKKSRILVTGGCGFIGSVLVKDLIKEGYQVRIADRLDFGGDSISVFVGDSDFEIEVGDLAEDTYRSEILEGIDCVVHLAGTVGIKPCAKDKAASYKNNYVNTQKLAEEAKKQGVKKFIFASTCSNYSACSIDQICTEESYVEAYEAYSESKIEAEKCLLKLNSPEFNIVIFRLATVFGISGRTRYCLLINHFTKDAYLNGKLSIFNGNFSRPYVHVLDVSRAFLMALKETNAKIWGEIFNLGSNEANCTKLDIAEKIKKYVPELEIKNEENLSVKDLRNYVVDFTKINKILGFSPSKSVEDGIREVLVVVSNGIVKDRKELYNY